ncbi:MAG TPA: efflux RND transporter periplasmic adaptor subunit [Gemmatimonadales bacterium]|nr:efflux RND transporter periplasmic adaptor subunit [Gemmatimonadales bacterium]
MSLILVSLTTWGCSEAAGGRRAGGPPAVPVNVAPVEQRDVPFEINAPGSVEPIAAVAVTAQVTGVVTDVRFNEGDEVRAGQVLVRLDPRPYANALQQAEATLARDVVQLENARRQVARYQGLAQSEYITSEQFEALRTSAEALAATVKSDSAAVDNARLNLEYTVIRSPLSGRTGSLLIKEGNLVRAQGSGPLVIVNQTRPTMVRFAVPANHLPLIRRYQGDSLVVTARAGDAGEPLQGVLAFVDNTVDTTTGTIQLKARFDNADGSLWPGQFVTATLMLYQERGAILVPVPAVVDGEEGPFVYVVGDDSLATTRMVTVGRNLGDLVIVTQGLEPGQSVVTDGQLRLTPGARVTVRRAAR